MKKSLYFLFLSILFIYGCATTYNPATGKKEFIYISTPQEVEMGRSVHQGVLKRYTLSQNKKYTDWVNHVGEGLTVISDRQDYAYHFYIIEKDELNAFTSPGGNIYVFTGLLDKLKSDDQLAAVLAHEIGHCAARHSVKKFQAALGYDLIGRIVLSQIEGATAQSVASLSSGAIMSIVFSSYSRKDEFEADRLAIKYMFLAGYDPNAIIETFEILKEGEKGTSSPQIFRTHPFLKDRIKAVRKRINVVKDRYAEELAAR